VLDLKANVYGIAEVVDEDPQEYVSSGESSEEENKAEESGAHTPKSNKISKVSFDFSKDDDFKVDDFTRMEEQNETPPRPKSAGQREATRGDGDQYARQSDSRSRRSRSVGKFSVTENNMNLGDLWQDRIYRVNLIIMILSWSASSFCFYIIGFYIKYIPGDVFVNVITTCIADAVSSIGAGLIAQEIGTQRTLFGAFALSSLGGVCLILTDTNNSIQIMVLIMATKFGINIAFTLSYIINAEYFPSIVCSRVFGICNIFSRISTILSPLIAEVTPPIPMVIYVLVCFISMVASLFLTKNEEAEIALQDLDDSLS